MLIMKLIVGKVVAAWDKSHHTRTVHFYANETILLALESCEFAMTVLPRCGPVEDRHLSN
jgi:hypothetical protein